VTQLTPVAPRERIATLDVLRGFALLGVLIGNMVLFTGDFVMRDVSRSAADKVVTVLIEIFVDSKAQTLLCFLFGFGFAIQLLRAQARDEAVLGVYLRRVIVLFGFGFAHVALLWWGDVTWTYAVAAIGLLALYRTPTKVQVIVAAIVIFVPVLVFSIPAARLWMLGVFMTPQELGAHFQHIVAVIERPDRVGLVWEHLVFAAAFSAQVWGWYFVWLVGRFLLGYVAGTKRWFERDGADHLVVFRRMLWGFVPGAMWAAWQVVQALGLVANYEFELPLRLAIRALFELALLGMVFGYVGVVVLLMQIPRWRRLLMIIAPAGRMPLTTYIVQSAVATTLMYGWGLGWYGMGPATYVPLALGIYAVQIGIAHVWLRYFRFGPLEWLWRWGVYLRRPPMRVASAS
jgi:uncharacterized protein